MKIQCVLDNIFEVEIPNGYAIVANVGKVLKGDMALLPAFSEKENASFIYIDLDNELVKTSRYVSDYYMVIRKVN